MGGTLLTLLLLRVGSGRAVASDEIIFDEANQNETSAFLYSGAPADIVPCLCFPAVLSKDA